MGVCCCKEEGGGGRKNELNDLNKECKQIGPGALQARRTPIGDVCVCAQVQAAAAELRQPRFRAAEPDQAEGFRGRARSDGAGGDGQKPQPVPDGV